MRWIGYSLLFIVLSAIFLIVLAPLSFVLEQAKKSVPALTASSSQGTIWNGQINDLKYGLQPVGDIKLKTDWMSIIGGALTSNISITDGSVLASGDVDLVLDGAVDLKNVRVRGNTSDLLSLRNEIRQLGGDFTVKLSELKLKSGKCVRGSGQAWTNILTRFEARYDWKGPELSGPLTCRNGQIVLQLSGTGEQGEQITALLEISLNATGRFRAEVEKATEKVAQAATVIGFVMSDEKLIYEHTVKPGN